MFKTLTVRAGRNLGALLSMFGITAFNISFSPDSDNYSIFDNNDDATNSTQTGYTNNLDGYKKYLEANRIDSTKAVEYNFIVKPGGKISDIQLKIEGGKNELVENKIRMQLRFGQMEETIPMSWIEQGNSKNEIKINYKRIKKNVYGFEGDLNSSNKIIVIDPVPVRLWGTYYGGSAGEYNQALTVDNFNNAYVAGETYSLNNISTSGSFITNNLNQNGSSYIVKLNSNGNRIWGTYIHNQNLPSSATKINSIVTSSLSEIWCSKCFRILTAQCSAVISGITT